LITEDTREREGENVEEGEDERKREREGEIDELTTADDTFSMVVSSLLIVLLQSGPFQPSLHRHTPLI
jgi:hypothetical protein